MLNADQIIAEAEVHSGMADSDTFVRKNLNKLVGAINTESYLSDDALLAVHRTLLSGAVNRLEGLKWLQKYPQIADEIIDRPIFLMGLPRSGTTYFQYLFDCDSRFRLLRTWEAMSPAPPPGADPESAEARRASWAERRRQLYPKVAGFDALHLSDEDGSEECHAFMEQSVGAAGLNNLLRVPSYFDYLLDEADLEASYRVHKRQLQLLQWRTAARPWALKYPNHLLAVPEILRVYPDARLVMTHRDPIQTLASIAKLSTTLRQARSSQPIDKHDVGRYMTHFIKRHVERIMTVAKSPLGEQIVHVDYYALVDDPVTVMTQVHQRLGMDSPQPVRQAVSGWHQANPKNARGRNDYNLAEYGLREDALAELFAEYIVHFNIPSEHQGLMGVSER